MDYRRIYDELIADRRANPPRDDEYVEVHHILPRRMGGSNAPENLIRLRPEDHFFAHLILAKAYGGIHWASVRVMVGAIHNNPRLRLREVFGRAGLRGRYGAAQRWAYERLSGGLAPNADKTVYEWANVDGRRERLTRADLAKKYKFRPVLLNQVVSGKIRSIYGWYLSDRTTPSDLVRPSGLDHPMADQKVYHFCNVDGREEHCTRLELVSRHKVSSSSLKQMVSGKTFSCGGWYLTESGHDGKVGHERTRGSGNGNSDKNSYSFQHIDGRSFYGTRYDLIKNHRVNRECLNAMMHGASLSANGWYLPDRVPDGVVGAKTRMGKLNNRFNDNVFDFVHDDGRAASATLYEMHLKYGGSRPAWTKIAIYGKTAYGWRLAGNDNLRRSSKGKILEFRSQSDVVFRGTQTEFAKFAGLTLVAAWRVAKGGQQNGWTLAEGGEHERSEKAAPLGA